VIWGLTTFSGHKDEEQYDPSGIIARSRTGDSKGVVFVAVNYRLGLFGWLNGLGDASILANVGLHDQILALNW
jgi:carboxylesterase type B